MRACVQRQKPKKVSKRFQFQRRRQGFASLEVILIYDEYEESGQSTLEHTEYGVWVRVVCGWGWWVGGCVGEGSLHPFLMLSQLTFLLTWLFANRSGLQKNLFTVPHTRVHCTLGQTWALGLWGRAVEAAREVGSRAVFRAIALSRWKREAKLRKNL